MRTSRSLVALLALSLGTGMISCASKEKKEKEQAQKAQQSSQAANQGSPAAQVILMPEAEYLAAQRLPLALMANSQVELAENNFGEAAANLKTASRLLRTREKQTSSDKAKNELATAAVKLDRLAPQVQSMQGMDANRLRASLADVAYHVGLSYRLQAEHELQANQYKLSGYDMATSAVFVEHGTQWTGQQADPNQLAQIRSTAVKLIRGTGWSREEVDQSIGRLDAMVGNLASNLGPAATAPERMPASQPPTSPTETTPQAPQGELPQGD